MLQPVSVVKCLLCQASLNLRSGDLDKFRELMEFLKEKKESRYVTCNLTCTAPTDTVLQKDISLEKLEANGEQTIKKLNKRTQSEVAFRRRYVCKIVCDHISEKTMAQH